MSKELRWGILSCGQISHDFVRAMRQCENNNVVKAVATANDIERAKEFAEKLELLGAGVNCYGSYMEMLQDKNIDVVYIGVQNQAHLEWVCKAAECGKDILCEKPMGVTAAEVQEMVHKAKENNVFLMEATWSRFFPTWRALKKEIDSQDFGEVKIINASFAQDSLPDSFFRPDMGATPLNIIGIYPVMFSMFCCNDDPPTKIHVYGNVENGCDKSANITLEFNGGKQKAYLMYSTEANSPNCGYVSFEKGIYEFPEWFWCPRRVVKITGAPQPGKKQTEVFDFPFNDNPDEFVYPNSTGLRYEADHIYECLQQGRKESPIMPWKSSLKLQEVLHELRRQLGVEYAQDKGL